MKALGLVLRGDTLRSELLHGGVGSVLIKLSYIGLGLGQTVLLARILGPSDYGVFAYVFVLITVLSMPAKLGLPNLLIRETARGQVDGRWDVVNGIWRWSAFVVCVASVILVAAAIIGFRIFPGQFTEAQVETLLWGLALVPFMALSNIAGAALRGLRYVVQGQLPEFVFRPVAFIALIISVVFLGQELTAGGAMMLRVLAAAGALAAGVWLLLRQEASRFALKSNPTYETRNWLFSTLPLALTTGMVVINQQADILMLGLFMPSETVGIYHVAMRGSTLVAFGLQVMYLVLLPYLARLFRQGQSQQLQRLVTLGARGVLCLTLPAAVALIVFGRPILLFVFGNEYVPASTPLAILAVGHLVSAFFGPVGGVLNMAGYEKDTARGVAIAAATNIALNLLLIPLFGMSGAAFATASSLTLLNVLLAYMAFKRTGIKTVAFHRLTG